MTSSASAHPHLPASQESIIIQIPPEILSYIFWFATAPTSSGPTEPNPDHPYELLPRPPFSDRSTVLHLGAVCSAWRRTIRSSTSIQISLSVNEFVWEIRPDLPWSRVGSLNLKGVRVKHACQLLYLCPNLVEFIFDKRNDLGGDGASVLVELGDIVLSSLQTLSWVATELYLPSNPDGSRVPLKPLHLEFFRRFRFPAIRTLKWDAELPSDAPEIRAFLESMRQVEELYLNPSTAKYSIDQYLDLFANITKLVMNIVNRKDEGRELLHRLTIKPNHGGNLFPQLQTLCLTVSGRDIDPDGLIIVLYSRRNSPVDWFDPSQRPERLTLLPYDPTSPHWQQYARLTMFSVIPEDEDAEVDWEWAEHYKAVMEPMFKEAKKVTEFATMWSESLIVF